MIDVLIEYDDGDEVAALIAGLKAGPVRAQPLRGDATATAQALVAGAIAFRILVDGVLAWARQARVHGVVYDTRGGKRVKLYRDSRAPTGYVLVLADNHEPAYFEATKDPSDLAALIASLGKI